MFILNKNVSKLIISLLINISAGYVMLIAGTSLTDIVSTQRVLVLLNYLLFAIIYFIAALKIDENYDKF